MAYTINGNIPCGTEACTGREHTPAGACKSVYDIILDAIKEVKGEVANVDSLAKEATLIAKVAELKEALNSIDFTTIEQAIQGVEDVTAKEATLIQGVADITKAVTNIDFSALAQEATLTQGVKAVKDAIDAIPATDLTTLEQAVAGTAKEETLNRVETKANEIIANVSQVQNRLNTTDFATQENLDSAKEEILTAVEEEADSIEKKIEDIVAAYNNGQEIIDQMVAIQLQTIIGGEE